MKVPFYIARRYLFSKKSTNVINVISGVSVAGVTTVTMVLIVILSVINGFNGLLESLFNSFDPDLKITINEGKTFSANDDAINKVRELEGVAHFCEILEENALFKYDDKEYIAVVKGVDEEFSKMSGIDSMIIDGEFLLKHKNQDYAVIGQGVAYFLSVGLNFIDPIKIYAPRRDSKVSLNPETAFNKRNIFPSGVFAVQQEYDSKYAIVPINFARELLDYNDDVSAIELKLDNGIDKEVIKDKIKSVLGDKYSVKDRYEQHEFIYKVMKSEKWAIFLILSFILLIASFNIIGSLTMLIIDKKKDIVTLQSLGADLSLIRKIFFIEGWMISIIGAVGGLILGALFCWLQTTYGIIKLQGSGSFIIDSYPVEIVYTDFIIVFFAVIIIGLLAAWYPVRYLTRKFQIFK